MTAPTATVDVFISRKSADAHLAKQLYQFLTGKGLTVFESDETLPRMGNSDYRKAIDEALDQCRHLLVVGSSIENIQSSWVEAEWGFFIGEKRAGRKPGNLVSVVTDNVRIEQLPPSLRNYEVIFFDPANFERLYAYVGTEGYTPQVGKSVWQLPRRWFWPTLAAVLALVMVIGFTYYKNQPFDLTLFAKPAADLQLNPNYPAFTGGEVVLNVAHKEERKQTLPNGEVVLKQLPASLLGQKVPIRLLANHWQAATDSIVLAQTVQLPLIPDGSLAVITGNVKNQAVEPIAGARVTIDNDTTLLTNAQGIFTSRLPYRMQKDQYRISVEKTGYKPYSLMYYPKSEIADVRLEAN